MHRHVAIGTLVSHRLCTERTTFVDNNRCKATRYRVPLFEPPHYVVVGSLPLTWLVALFFFISAFAHLGNVLLWREYYFNRLEQCIAPLRYAEYALSAPVMIILVGYTAGNRDYTTLLAYAGLIATTMLFGYLGDLLARPESPTKWKCPLYTRLRTFALGCIPYGFAYGLILANFYDQSNSSERAPWFVHLIIWGQFALFTSFATVPIGQQLREPKMYYQGEVVFQILSLTSKAVLGITFITNILVLGSFQELFD